MNSTNNNKNNSKNNNNKKNQYEESVSIVLDLEILSIRYRNLLVEYENVVNNYISYLGQQNNTPSMVTVNNSAYWGTTTLGQSTSKTLQECRASCASNKGCTGATYNSANSTCYLRGGDGPLTAASDTEVAIVSKKQQILSNIKSINQQLTQINKQIQNETNSGEPLYNFQSQERKTQTSELIRQFLQLNKERNEIEKMINEYQTLDQQQIQGNLTVNQNYYSFVLLLFLAFIIIIILWYFGRANTNSNTNSNYGSQQQSNGLSAGYLVLITFLIALLIVCIAIVMSKTGTNISGISTSLIPTSLPEIKLPKFGWN